jgi:hypothetical protein
VAHYQGQHIILVPVPPSHPKKINWWYFIAETANVMHSVFQNCEPYLKGNAKFSGAQQPKFYLPGMAGVVQSVVFTHV